MKVETAVREFKYGSMTLADPDPAQTPEEVKAFYANIYPELNNAEIESEQKGAKTVYEFRKAVGTKGAPQITPGVMQIMEERDRQLNKLGWTIEHDDAHDDHSLALAACAYAAPVQLFRCVNTGHYVDCWPRSWDESYDKRKWIGDPPYPAAANAYVTKTRLRNLVKAGALIAAEIDRLLRAEAKRGKG